MGRARTCGGKPDGKMMARTATSLVLARRPEHDEVVTRDHFTIRANPVPELEEGQFMVRTCWLGLDPAQRGWLREDSAYVAPVAVGEVMRGSAVGEVVESRSRQVPLGTVVSGFLGWRDYAVVDDADEVWVVPPELERPASALGLVGTPGLTAYFGMLDIGRPKPGDSVVVTAAAGATGSVAAQLARAAGATVVGIAGGEEKCEWLRDVAHIDHTIDYHVEQVSDRLRQLCPGGFNVVYDNVGGWILDSCLDSLAVGARVVIGGAIASRYSSDSLEMRSVSKVPNMMTRRAMMQGFLVIDFEHRFPEARGRLLQFAAAGKIATREDMVVGDLVDAPATLQRLFDGRNLGKQVLQIAEPDERPVGCDLAGLAFDATSGQGMQNGGSR